MPDVTISAVQTGAYETALAADTPKSVLINRAGVNRRRQVEISHVSGASPIYVGRATLAAKAATAAAVVPVGGKIKVNVPPGGTLWFVSAGVATFTVRKL